MSWLPQVEWWPDSSVYENLVDLVGSPEKALAEIKAAVLTGQVQSIRLPRYCEGDPWNQQKENGPEFWQGRRYFRLGNGLLDITDADGETVDCTWSIMLSSEDACKQWPSLRPHEAVGNPAGRPSSTELVQGEATRRVTGDDVLPTTFKEFTNQLSRWIDDFPGAPPMKPKTVERHVRKIWRLREKRPIS